MGCPPDLGLKEMNVVHRYECRIKELLCRLGAERAAVRFLVLKLPDEKMNTCLVLGNSELVVPRGIWNLTYLNTVWVDCEIRE